MELMFKKRIDANKTGDEDGYVELPHDSLYDGDGLCCVFNGNDISISYA